MTAATQIDEGARDFLRRHVQSYEALQILLSVCAEPESAWTTESLCARLKLARHLIETALHHLCADSLLVRTRGAGGETYSVHDPAVIASVRRLAVAYEEQPLEVIKLMSANAIERLRTAALQAFADAFIIRKDKGDG